MIKIAILGAGGKMGYRISKNLKDESDYKVAHVEVSEAGILRLRELGISVVPQEKAIPDADIVILAVPDVLIGKITHDIVPLMKSESMLFGLDPAAAYAEVMPIRKDISYFVAHPSHPPVFHDETDPVAQKDYFGGIAKQSAVCALYHGKESEYEKGEILTRKIYAPVKKTYRISIEQMAILEPALVETFSSTLMGALKKGFDKAVEMGVPYDAALDFLMGHVRVQLAVLFGYADFRFSDGAIMAMEQAKSLIFKDHWKEKIFTIESIKKSVKAITDSIKK